MSGTVQSVRGESLIPTSLGELAEYVTSGSRDWSKYYASSGAVFIRTQDINRNRLSLDDVAHVALPERVEGKRSLVKKGDLLITITGANVGKVAAVDFDPPEAYVSQSVCLVRLKNPDLAKFVQLQLIARKGDKSALEAMAYGLGRPVLNLENIKAAPVLVGSPELHAQIVAEIEKQFSRLDEAVANLQRVKANLKRYEKATIESLTNPASFTPAVSGSVADVAVSLDNLRKPVNKLERAKRPGPIPYLGANGPTGWIDVPLFDEELVLVVEDETFVGRTAPFCYFFSGKCWVNNHTHVLRARPEVVLPKYLNLALSYYPFIPLTTGSTGRRKLTKAALMSAPISVPSLAEQRAVISEVDRQLSISRGVESEIQANLQRANSLRNAILSSAFLERAINA
ncbi:MAG: hypothetical protein A2X72_02085 [Burkholderiales bacterium GWF1_66_17]|nr:MAG: hypothetical protein A2X73_21465 [Burkholderiales bacterium GWE1_65_30]OGA94194.1 MAG: hypothetical protein A2X72_02085 [Burkholderiales bacterium GWF1_66_17]HBU19225.1 hypothetical protein [Hydrogenophaga sp.]